MVKQLTDQALLEQYLWNKYNWSENQLAKLDELYAEIRRRKSKREEGQYVWSA